MNIPESESVNSEENTMMMNPDTLELEIRRQRGKTVNAQITVNAGEAETEGIRMEAVTRSAGGSLLLEIGLEIRTGTLEESFLLDMERPVSVTVPLSAKPEKITAMYLYNPWWTRPAFVDSCEEIPDKTQIAFFRFADRAACCIPMVGDRFKTILHGGKETALRMEMTAYKGGISRLREPVLLWSEANTVEEAVHQAFIQVSRIKNVPLRNMRRIPDMFRYLGWCSWDAFGTDVSAEGVRTKAAELTDKNVPVRWILIDDGWMEAREKTVAGFKPDEEKFPGGFTRLTDDLRSRDGIRWFGVWHALGGYWDGITPGSALASEEAGALLESDAGRIVPDPRNSAQFYHDWYKELRSEGIDFVKVDGQSACPFYYENIIPISEAARGIHESLESGVSRMDGAVINCMGMAMENIVARPSSAVSRNSDDFLPAKEDSFVEHLLQNAYNSVYHNEIYCCDWDMFWTTHVHAKKHALLRAVSGGPVYVSDKPGMTDPDILRPLAYADGQVLMMARSAKPVEDCLFTDPRLEGVLKIHNVGCCGNKPGTLSDTGDSYDGGGMAVLNLTDRPSGYTLRPSEIPDLRCAEVYWMYDYFTGNVTTVDNASGYTGELQPGETAWHVLLPKTGNCRCFGLLDKYAGFMAVENVSESENTDVVILHESGRTGWASDREIVQVMADAEDVTQLVERQGAMYILPLPEKGQKTVLTIRWKNR